MSKRLAALTAAAFLVGLSTCGQDKGTFIGASITKCEPDGSFIALSDGSKFRVDVAYREISKKWGRGILVHYRLSPDGRCPRYELQSVEPPSETVCVSFPPAHGGKEIPIQVVQTLTKNAVVTENSSFAWAIATLIPRWQRNAAQGPTTTGQQTSTGTSVSTEVTKIVGLDTMLNDQKVRLRCAQSSCHGLNANSYKAELKGADIWITSYGLEWDAKQEKLVQEEYNEHWKVVGAWQ